MSFLTPPSLSVAGMATIVCNMLQCSEFIGPIKVWNSLVILNWISIYHPHTYSLCSWAYYYSSFFNVYLPSVKQDFSSECLAFLDCYTGICNWGLLCTLTVLNFIHSQAFLGYHLSTFFFMDLHSSKNFWQDRVIRESVEISLSKRLILNQE